MTHLWRKLKDESAGAMVENVIVLPLVFVVILFMVISAFLIHDRSTIEAAARRGATYGAHCLADPNYEALVGHSGDLDFSKDATSLDFSCIGKNIKPYRYINGGPSVKSAVETEVKAIVNKTRINWIPQERITVECQQKNKVIYQDLTVKVKATYSLPGWLAWFGLETRYSLETDAKIAAVDPDEFIRNADLVVDLITQVDKATGGHLQKAVDSIGGIAAKLLDWIKLG